MKFLQFILVCFVFIYANASDSLQIIQKYKKRDKVMFDKRVQTARNCISKKDLSCFLKALGGLDEYANSKKDLFVIQSLKDEYKVLRKRIKRKNLKRVDIKTCSSAESGYRKCRLYVNGKYDGFIFYGLKNDEYKIYIGGSKYVALGNNGFYTPKIDMLFTTGCGRTKMGKVKNLEQALKMYVECAYNGSY